MTHSVAAQMAKMPTNVLFSSDLWNSALEKYAQSTHTTVKLFDTDLRLVFGPIHPTPLFELFGRGGYDPGLFAECARQCLAQTTERPALTVSKAYGLAVVGTSLVLDGKIVGAAVAGYVLVDFSQLLEIRRVAKDARLDFEKVWQVAREQSPVSHQRLNVNGELLQVLGDALLRENLRTRQYERAALELQETGRAKENAYHELQQTTSVLRESEERYRTLFHLGPIAVYSCDASGVIREYNHVAAELWGREPKLGETDERWCGSFRMLRPDGVVIPHEQCPMAEVLSGKVSAVHDGEVQIERPDGSRITVAVNIRPLMSHRGELTGAINCFYDITDRKRAEEKLELTVEQRTAALRQLSSNLLHAQDDERRRIARELHDSVGQYLAHANMIVGALQRSEATEKQKEGLTEVSGDLEACITETRTISHLLHPPLLDEFGLSSAVNWYVDEFAKRSGIQVNLTLPRSRKRLPGSLELVFFRILQESLVNVHRHSRSQSVDITLERKPDKVTLEVADHGQGMPPELLERVAGISELGGRFELQSDKKGTLIRATVPLSRADRKLARAAGKAS